MQEFRAKLHENGRIVIPAACRKALNLMKGEELVIAVENGEARIFSLKHAVKEAQDLLRQYKKDNKQLSSELIKQRRDAAKDE